MATIRQKYFDCIKIKKDHVSDSDIRDLLIFHCGLKSYTDLTIHFDDEIKNENAFNINFNALQNGEMIQYILGDATFLGEKFYVNKHVLIPRQETEQLVCLTSDLIRYNFDTNDLNIADLCTGSGVLGITLSREFPRAIVTVTDIDEHALAVCNVNIKKFNKNIRVLRGNFINPLLELNEKFDVIICNPPYIENEKEIDKRTWGQEPHLALLAKPGTMFYEILIENISKIMKDHFLIAFEIGEDLEDRLIDILKKNGLEDCYKFEQDIYGKTRFLFIMR